VKDGFRGSSMESLGGEEEEVGEGLLMKVSKEK